LPLEGRIILIFLGKTPQFIECLVEPLLAGKVDGPPNLQGLGRGNFLHGKGR